ncbi:MAG: dethiobiotin synthase [Pirellulaceae bacterium]
MKAKAPCGLFITGTDTGVGKTYVGALIVKSLCAAEYRVGVYKPVASGCQRNEQGELVSDDALELWNAAGKPATLDLVCPRRFAAPLAPHLAAAAEGQSVQFEELKAGIKPWQAISNVVIVEGAGGLMSPVTENEFVADLAEALALPLIVVVPNRIGAINQALQTLITASCFRDGLPVAGIILNDLPNDAADPSRESNEKEIARRSPVPVLARVLHDSQQFDRPINWRAVLSPLE